MVIVLAYSTPSSGVDKNGVGPNAVSLPTGAGSIQGLGETFEPELTTGTAVYQLDIVVAPGPAGHAPELRLDHNSGFGNGQVGVSWRLTIPLIQRKTSKGIPRYVEGPNGIDDDGDGVIDEPDEIDRFINRAGKNLIPREDGYYFMDRESAFIRYERRGDSWAGTLPDGTLREFGLTPQARVQSSVTGRIFTWLLERQTDVHGNTITYTYTGFPSRENQNQRYLAKVEYGAGPPPWDNKHFVVFEYETRPDWFESCRANFVVRTGMRLRSVTVGTQGPARPGHAPGDFDGDGTDDYLNRRYTLAYEGHPHWSLLTQVAVTGADGVSDLPPLRLTWNANDPPASQPLGPAFVASSSTPRDLMDREWVELSDLNGDALPDILKTEPFGGLHTVYLNLGEADIGGQRTLRWSAPLLVGGDERVWSVNLADTGNAVAFLADMTADGRSDLVYKTGNDVFYFPAENDVAGVAWGARVKMFFDPTLSAPAFPFDSESAVSADVNGDKRMDILQSLSVANQADYRYWLNLGGNMFAKPMTVPQEGGVPLGDNDIRVEDFNGDGLPDIVRVKFTGLEVASGFGYGRFEEPIFVPFPDITLTEALKAAVNFVDLNGNGLRDMVIPRAAPGEVWYWLSKGNYELEERRVLTGLPAFLSTKAVIRWADMNGNASEDLVIIDPLAAERMRIFDIGDLIDRPLLLERIDNGVGRSIEIVYGTQIPFLLEARAAGNPWIDPMPFVLDIVVQATTTDSLGNTLTTDFSYDNPYYSVVLRSFTGFARAATVQRGDESEPTLVTRSHFDVGKSQLALRGKLLRTTLETEGGEVFEDTTMVWEPRLLYTGIDEKEARFPIVVAQSRDILERGQGTPVRIELEFDFDDFGNEILQRNFGVVENGDPAAFGDEIITTREFAINEEAWIVQLPARVEVANLAGEIISRTETFYDDETFSGTNFGVVTKGNRTLVRKWPNPADAEGHLPFMRARYDAYGNATTLLDPLASVVDGAIVDGGGHYRSVDFDDAFHTHAVREIVHVGAGEADLVIDASYDEVFGVLTSSVDFNGSESVFGYDVFGRLTSMVRSGDSVEFPTAEFSYVLAQPFGDGVINYVETRLLDRIPGQAGTEKRDHYFITRKYVDGLGRARLLKREAEPDPDTGALRVAVFDGVLFNARSLKVLGIQPFFTALPGADLESLLAFEDVEDAAWSGVFHLNGELETLALAQAPAVSTAYDAMGRSVATTNADGSRRTVAYEPLLTAFFDEHDANPESIFFDTPLVHYKDGLGRLVQVDERVRLNDDGTPAAELKTWTSRYTYRADDKLLRIADAQSNEKWFEYDGLGRKVFMNDANRGVLALTYDAASNVSERIDAKGQRTTFTYDGANRVLTEDYHDEGLSFSFGRVFNPAQPMGPANLPDVAFFYDEPAGAIDFGNGGEGTAGGLLGRLAYTLEHSGETHISYDVRGNTEWVVKRITDPRTGALTSFKSEMKYDSQDRVVEVVYPDGDAVRYTYNARNHVDQILGGASMNAGATPFLLSVDSYTPAGNREHSRFGNGALSEFEYDARGRLVALSAVDPVAGLSFMDFAYGFDAVSNMTSVTDLRTDLTVPVGDPRRNSQTFSYDDAYRLASVQYSFGLAGQPERDDGRIEYRYDRIGNMVAKRSAMRHEVNAFSVTNLGDMAYGGAAGPSGRIGRNNGDGPGPHALSSAATADTERLYEYDDNGNLVEGDGLSATWDFKDRLVALESSAMKARYVYDHSDRRTIKTVWNRRADGAFDDAPSLTTLYAGKHFEVREGRQATKFVFDGDTRIAKVTGTLDDTRPRVQRFAASPGWNLFSMAVDAPDAAAQLGIGKDPAVGDVYRWEPGLQDYVQIDGAGSLPAGSVFWVYADEALALAVQGAYSDPTEVSMALASGFVAMPSLDALPTDVSLPQSLERLWGFDGTDQTWLSKFGGTLGFLSDFPEFIEPAQAAYTDLSEPGDLQFPAPAQRIAYYIQDHLGSSSVLVDGAGNVTETTTYYPFGEPRHRFTAQDAGSMLPNPYLFEQKERDRESGLQYFETRYLMASLARFNRVDPAVESVPKAALADPQLLHAYGFSRNNPLVLKDPDGAFPSGFSRPTLRLLRQVSPFSDQTTGNKTDTASERRTRVFAVLKIKPGGKVPEGQSLGGQSIPDSIKKELEAFKTTTQTDPNKILNSIISEAERLKSAAGAKGVKINFDSFINALTEPVDNSPTGETERLGQFEKLLAGGDLENSPVTKSGKFINKGIAAQVGRLQVTLGSIDLKAKSDEFNKILEKQGFDFDQGKVDEFIDKFLDLDDNVEDQNRKKENKRRENES